MTSRRVLRSEDGSATVEFVMMLPFILMLGGSAVELGMLNNRQAMLDRGLDLAVRAVRLGQMPEVTHDALKDLICEAAVMIPDCARSLKLEMRPLDPRDWGMLADDVDCVDNREEAEAVREFRPGASNELMILRACALFDVIVPGTGLGFHLSGDGERPYALVSATAFAIEPQG